MEPVPQLLFRSCQLLIEVDDCPQNFLYKGNNNFFKYNSYTMSYFYNPLLKQNLQKNTGGGGDPDYSKIKGLSDILTCSQIA